MSVDSPVSLPSPTVAVVRFLFAWITGLTLIAVLTYGAIWVWGLHGAPSVEVHDNAGILDEAALERELASLSFNGPVHIAVLTMNSQASSGEEVKEEIKHYALSHVTEAPWVYEDISSPQWIWADTLVLFAIVPNQDAVLVAKGGFIRFDVSEETINKEELSAQLPPEKLVKGIANKASQAEPTLPLPERPWWQKVVPILMGALAVFGILAALGSILALRDRLTQRAALMQRLRVLAELNKEELTVIARSPYSSTEAAHYFYQSEREKQNIEQGIDQVRALLALSIPQMTSEYAHKQLARLEQQVTTLERSLENERSDAAFLVNAGDWRSGWEKEIASVKADCQSARSFLQSTGWFPTYDNPDGAHFLALPDRVLSECEGVDRAVTSGEIEPAFALKRLRECDTRLRQWLLVDIVRLMKASGMHVRPFNERFDDKVVAIESRYYDPHGDLSRENLMRYRLAEAAPGAVGGSAVAHYVSLGALAQALEEWV